MAKRKRAPPKKRKQFFDRNSGKKIKPQTIKTGDRFYTWKGGRYQSIPKPKNARIVYDTKKKARVRYFPKDNRTENYFADFHKTRHDVIHEKWKTEIMTVDTFKKSDGFGTRTVVEVEVSD
jgi:hypothetical protein